MTDIAKVARAIAIVERSRQTHILWRDYFSTFSGAEITEKEAECQFAGSLENHVAYIAGYDEVLAVLNDHPGVTAEAIDAARASVQPIKYAK